MGQKEKQKQAAWTEAKRRCRLSVKEIEMAKQLGMTPKSLIKNIPAPSQSWKLPVKDWKNSAWMRKMDFLSELHAFH